MRDRKEQLRADERQNLIIEVSHFLIINLNLNKLTTNKLLIVFLNFI
jgi:hypothetical protein